jgi:hypothetical protein
MHLLSSAPYHLDIFPVMLRISQMTRVTAAQDADHGIAQLLSRQTLPSRGNDQAAQETEGHFCVVFQRAVAPQEHP